MSTASFKKRTAETNKRTDKYNKQTDKFEQVQAHLQFAQSPPANQKLQNELGLLAPHLDSFVQLDRF